MTTNLMNNYTETQIKSDGMVSYIPWNLQKLNNGFFTFEINSLFDKKDYLKELKSIRLILLTNTEKIILEKKDGCDNKEKLY